MNNNDIKKILNDLYALDPSLREHEKELIAIVRAMAIKPEAHLDAAFAARLRTQLLTELAQNPQMQASAQRYSLSDILMARSFRYAILGVAVIAVGVVAIVGLQPKASGPVALNGSKVTITNVGSNAFGSLSTLSTSGSGGSASGQTPEAATNGASAGSAAASPMIAVAPVPIPPPNNFAAVKYTYTGDPISQDQSQLNVLKKIPQTLSADAATAALAQAGFGQVDLSTFSNLNMSNVTLAEKQSFGYDISIDFVDGTIGISQDYNEWPQNTGDTKPLTASDIPSDSAVIATANQFLASHNISTANYGTPEVMQNNNFIVPLDAPVATPAAGPAQAGNATNGSVGVAMPMIPYYSDSEQVLYPLMVNGMNVYDTGGNKVGLNVEVNVRYNRVANVYGLETESYQSSAYDAITDSSTIISTAENAQTYPIFYNVANGSPSGITQPRTVYNLGTPTMGYADMYQSDAQGNSSEFLVPSFIFPVTNNGSDTPIRNIVVPLIKDFQQQQQGVMIPAVPEPMQAGGGAASAPAAK